MYRREFTVKMTTTKKRLIVLLIKLDRAIFAGLFDTPKQRRSHNCRGAARKLRHDGTSRRTKGFEKRRGKINVSYLLSERPDVVKNVRA